MWLPQFRQPVHVDSVKHETIRSICLIIRFAVAVNHQILQMEAAHQMQLFHPAAATSCTKPNL